ncbi:MAG: CpsD/CapB family tyrosine-protein kinase [Oscillospiraceae bacterium]|nr:CpsD/CapB family tyrosine-protein kinase [Oscillospiraceae bacterium]
MIKLKFAKKAQDNKPKPAKKKDDKSQISVMRTQEQENILNENSSFTTREAYNALRTNIIFSIPQDGCKVIGFTSAESGEGKSINILNMSISFAESGARVLLVDCDLRKPKLGLLLGMKAAPGIANVLVGVQPISKAIRRTKYENLSVLLSGGVLVNPTELLNSEKYMKLLQDLSAMYDYIFVDTPPVNVVADASIISKYLAGYVFVVRQGSSERDSVANALGQLKFVNAKVLGFLLNDVTHNRSKRSNKYGYYYEYSAQAEKEASDSAGGIK